MDRPYRHIHAERRGDVTCARFRSRLIAEPEVHEVFEELLAAGKADGCRRLALSFGPRPPEMLYSVFLAKLFTLQRVLTEAGRELVLCDVSPAVEAMLTAVAMQPHFRYAADCDDAAALPPAPPPVA
jgi:hypothetical protein